MFTIVHTIQKYTWVAEGSTLYTLTRYTCGWHWNHHFPKHFLKENKKIWCWEKEKFNNTVNKSCTETKRNEMKWNGFGCAFEWKPLITYILFDKSQELFDQLQREYFRFCGKLPPWSWVDGSMGRLRSFLVEHELYNILQLCLYRQSLLIYCCLFSPSSGLGKGE